MDKYLPLIGVSADVKWVESQPFHAVGEKYLRAVAESSGCAPLIIPALTEWLDLPPLVARLDGIFFTGSLSNVHPQYYDRAPSQEHEPYDPARDQLTMALIRETVAQHVPLLAVCRGFQELNVALGGTLHAAVHELPGRLDHRVPKDDDRDVQYGPNHELTFIPDGKFYELFSETKIMVNSLHRQGIDELAPGLVAEGFAPDGTIEAVSVENAKAFALGVQWHPEYKSEQNAFSKRLFGAFGDAARERARLRY